MEITVEELSKIVDGIVVGDKNIIIKSFSPIEEATQGSITFLSNPKYSPHLYTTRASAVLISKEFELERNDHPTLIRVKDVYSTLSSLLERFNHHAEDKNGKEDPCYISDSATLGSNHYVGAFTYIGKKARIGKNVKIYPNCYIGDESVIDDNTIIYAGVRIYRGTAIGKKCIIHSGCIIGGDGFGFAPQQNGSYKKLPQTGNVVIEDYVEIGSNTTIDRATIQSTVIRKGAKLDNLIQVAHNVEIGENTAIAAQTGISGSTKIGKNCIIGGQVGIVGHITIADGSQIGAQSGVPNSIKIPNKQWFGSPIAPLKESIRAGIIFKKLPDLYKRIKELEKFVSEAKSRVKQER